MQTMTDLAGSYLERLRPKVAHQTWLNKRGPVIKLATEWDKTRRLPRRMDTLWLEDFLIRLRAGETRKELLGTSYNIKLKNLAQFTQWLVRRGVLENVAILDLFDEMRVKQLKRDTFTRLTLQQAHQLVEGIDDERSRFVIAFGLFSLGRAGELTNCRVRDVSFDTQEIKWYRPKTDDYDALPMTSALENAMRRWLRHYAQACPEAVVNGRLSGDAYLIPRRVGGQVPYRLEPFMRTHELAALVKKHITGVLNVEKLQGEACHVLRRSGARALYDRLCASGLDPDPLRTVQTMLGHASGKTTERYLGTHVDRQRRDDLLKGSDLMSLPTENVIQLRSVGDGS